MIFEWLWQETGRAAVLQQLLRGRRLEVAVERAVLLTVLPRLLQPGSDRAGPRFHLRSELRGTCGRVFQAAGVAVPPAVQQLS